MACIAVPFFPWLEQGVMQVLLTESQILAGVERLAAEVRAHYRGEPLTVVAVLTGSLVLTADLIRRLDMPLRVGVVQSRSYRGAATMPGALSIAADALPELRGRNVLLVDDIFDTGHTLQAMLTELRRHEPASLRSAVLLRKQGRRQVDVEPDHVAFDIPDRFVVGYGLDYDDLHRNLPYVAALDDAELARGRPR
jgi:hypoxanthine phosphoribosyltransferase